MAEIFGSISYIDDSEYVPIDLNMPRTQHSGFGKVIVKDVCRSSHQQPLSLPLEAGGDVFTDLPALSRCSSRSSISSLPTPTTDLSIHLTSQKEELSSSHDLWILSHFYHLPQIERPKSTKTISIMSQNPNRSTEEIELGAPASVGPQPRPGVPTFKEHVSRLPERQRIAREAEEARWAKMANSAVNDEYEPLDAAFDAALTAIRDNKAEQANVRKPKRKWASFFRKLGATCDKSEQRRL